MKKALFILVVFAFTLKACGQTDQTFNKPPYFPVGFYLGTTFWPSNTPIGGGGSGTADWNTMINKPATFPPSAHNHDLLYKPFNYVPSWNEITGKPLLFPPALHTHAWEEITGKPQEISLPDAIEALGYLPIPERTTAEINAIVLPAGKSGIVKDKTLGVYKLWNNGWSKIVITNN